METSLQRTFAGAESNKSATALLHDNSKPETAEKCAAIEQLKKAAKGKSLCGVMAHGRLGVGLIDLKDHLKKVEGHGRFESMVEDKFKIRTTWRTQLMFLGRYLSEVEPAIAWAKATDRFTGTEYSVRVVNYLLRAWLKRNEFEGSSETASPPERTEMRWSDVLRVIDWAKISVKDANHDLDQMAGLLREWETGGEKTGSSAKSVRRDTYPKKDIIKALVWTSNIADLVFRNNQQLRERIAVLESELERERARRPTTPESPVQDAILVAEALAVPSDDGGGEAQ